MLHIGNEKVSLCDGHGSVRRSFLQAAVTPKELCLIVQGYERSELPWETDFNSFVPQRGSVIGGLRRPQPFQGRSGV